MAELDVKSPRVFDGPIAEAFKIARADLEPILVPQPVHADDRGFSLMNQFVGVLEGGQVNYSVQHPGVVKAWHRHDKQTDFWLALHGHIKVGVHRGADNTVWATVIGERRPAVVVIPPPLWHGAATVGAAPAGLLYYVTHAFDPGAADEHRRAHDALPGFPWGTEHR